MDEPIQLELLRLQGDLRSRLHDVHDVRKALVYGLRATRELFGAHQAAVATLSPGRSQAKMVFTIPRDDPWDEDLLSRYIAGTRPRIPENVLLAPVQRRGRKWAVLALKYRDRRFSTGHRQALFSITQLLTEIVRAVDERRAHKVRRRIEHKIADRQEPKDLIYDILHGMRSLTRYDHSATLFLAKDGSDTLELMAEQIAWTKAKSKRIGLRLELDEELRDQLTPEGVRLFERVGGDWHLRRGAPAPSLPRLLGDAGSSSEVQPSAVEAVNRVQPSAVEAVSRVPPEVSTLCASIVTPGGALAVLKISARRRGVLGDYEARLVEEFIPLASLAVQFLVRTESLQEQVLKAERKHALANLTRGITHDLNNALGAMLPLVQQMREDVRRGQLDASTLSKDLESIERSLQTCRRIFGGMLAIARGSAQGVGHGNLRRAIEGALSVLEDSLRRRAIEVALDLPEEMPTIHGSQGDLTQVFLNLFTNARDAMTGGGRLEIAARDAGEEVRVTVRDTGDGMGDEVLERVAEPFFTTKEEGNGLGLAICRSILWEVGGEMTIESQLGKGTCVRLSLPVLDESRQEAAE